VTRYIRLFFTLLTVVLLLTTTTAVYAAISQGYPLQHIEVDIHNRNTLQRGAKYFINYCLSCHSSRYARYQWVGRDLGLSEEMIKKDFIFTDSKVGDLMVVSMPAEGAQQWFGALPPDLTLVARARGKDWLYTYLKAFYLDDTRPMGVNNAIFQHVSMPHVLWDLQGWQKPVYKTISDENGTERQIIVDFELVEPGTLSEKEYDRVVRDIVTFLSYLAEPAKLERHRVGIWVIIFLLGLLVVVYLLKWEYWKDVEK